MAKASEFVRTVLLKLVQTGAEQPIEQVDAQDVLEAMNDMMAEWEGVGISLGYTEVSSLGDEVTVPDSTKRAIKSNLAVYVADQFGKQVDASTILSARETWNNIVNQYITINAATFSGTLPTGAGNNCGDNFNSRFFPGDVDGTLTRETGGAILTEEDTE